MTYKTNTVINVAKAILDKHYSPIFESDNLSSTSELVAKFPIYMTLIHAVRESAATGNRLCSTLLLALAVTRSSPGHPVHLTTNDPFIPFLKDVFNSTIFEVSSR